MPVKKPLKIISLILTLAFCLTAAQAKSNKCTGEITKLHDLVAKPKQFLHKKVTVKGEFHSFSNLPLDYEPAMRSSKDFIGIMLARPDQKEIPLVELKMSAPIKMFKKDDITINHGDLVTLEAKVYDIALGEPWLEITEIDIEAQHEESEVEQI